MSAIPKKLTLAPYLQRWDAARSILQVRLLVMPTGNPMLPLGNGLPPINPGPSFADAQLVFKACLSKNWRQLPAEIYTDATEVLWPAMPSDRTSLFTALENQFTITKAEEVNERTAAGMVRKHLMGSYQKSFPFVKPKTSLASTDKSYACLLNCPPKAPVPAPPVDPGISWAEALSFALRQPYLAEAMGLIYSLEIPITQPEDFKDGGWLFFTLDATSDFADLMAFPEFLKILGTRIPPLAVSRQLFTPVLFPVVDDPALTPVSGNFDEAFQEAAMFHDGFSKIVHASQPVNSDPLEEEPLPDAQPLREEGIQLGWDDEDIVIGQNRQLGVEPDTMAIPAEAPLGVVGYRVDVKSLSSPEWHSLSRVHADTIALGNLRLDDKNWESRVEVFPSTIQDQFWLPSYFTRWKGGSLVVTSDEDLLLLSGKKRTQPLYYQPKDAQALELKYGNTYQFRVRMVDTTNGGPAIDDQPIVPGQAPICTWTFKRHIRPGAVTWPQTDMSPDNATITTYTIARPTLELPQALYTDYPDVRSKLLAIQENNIGKSGSDSDDPVIPDPDATVLEIVVKIKTPDFDTSIAGKDKEGFVEWYTTRRRFPVDPHQTYAMQLAFEDVAVLDQLDITPQLAADASGTIALPTARDIKLELRAVGKDQPNYFGNDACRYGAVSVIKLHKRATAELLAMLPLAPQEQIRSVFLQPENVEAAASVTNKFFQNGGTAALVKRLAGASGMMALDNTLLMAPGLRGVFACSSSLKHYLPANRSSLVLMDPAELSKKWLNVLRWKVNRDWTWKGFDTPTCSLERELFFNTKDGVLPAASRKIVGEWSMMHAVTPLINEEANPEKNYFEFIFLDGMESLLDANGLPQEIIAHYYFTMRFANGEKIEIPCANHLPITQAPTQVPKIVSAGIALTPYQIGEDYATTGERRKMLWLEMEEAPKDSRDAYFVRVTASAPDPMLLAGYEPTDEKQEAFQWALDPELIRVVVNGQSDDAAGWSTMQKLIPSVDSPRHFLVPLPPGVYADSPELFGFYSYEVRVGHDKGGPGNPFWSTAQGRFGPSASIDGVQHPAASLPCHVFKSKTGIFTSGTYAQAYLEGQNIQALPPQTEIWFVLYAQVLQMDGSIMRNIELDKKEARALNSKDRQVLRNKFGIRLPDGQYKGGASAQGKKVVQNRKAPLQGHAFWTKSEIVTLLNEYGLSEKTPLSVLGVELLPEPTGKFGQPLGGDLGEVRIYRTSILQAAEGNCC